MPINFPDAPSSGDTHTVGDKTWTYDGTAWNLVTGATADHGNLDGLGDDDHTQYALADGTRGTFEASGAVSTHEAASDPHTQYLLSDGSRAATELTVSGDLTVDTDTLYVDATSNFVGIGTATPSGKLHVKGPSTADTTAEIVVEGNGSTALHGSLGQLSYNGMSQSGDKGIIFTDGTIGTGNFVIAPWANSTSGLRMDSSGNVGIGDPTPSYKLDVSGDINSTGNIRANNGQPLGMALIVSGSLIGTTTNFTNVFTSAWQHYRIIIDPLQNGSTTGTYFRFLNSSGNAVTTGYYSAYFYDGSFGRINNGAEGYLGTGSYFGWGGVVCDITAPSGEAPSWHISATGHNVGAGTTYDATTRGYCSGVTGATGIQFFFGAPYGNVRIYGVA